MILVWTAVHGRPENTYDAHLAAIDANVPAPFHHWIGSDFSPEPDASYFAALRDTLVYRDGACVGSRSSYHCRDIGAERSPSMGLSLRTIWEMASPP